MSSLSARKRFGSLDTHRVACVYSDQTARMRRPALCADQAESSLGAPYNLVGNAVPPLVFNDRFHFVTINFSSEFRYH